MSEADGLADPDPSEGEDLLGGDGELIRALTFSGGAFDTTMQLGVVHALLVIQGRAPDAVVGVSAGAVNAAALAEVLQAGEELEPQDWSGLDPARQRQVHTTRMRARVSRFRGILDAFHQAPERLVDGLLPDAYQIDSRRPLRPVQMPVFRQEERERRKEALASRSGLVKLYNDLLGLGITFGTLTRAVRRILGLSAAAEVRQPAGRFLLRTLESVRLWILLGNRLFAIAPLLRILVLPSPSFRRRQEGETAGGLIFRFKFVTALGRAAVRWGWFVFVLTVWVWVTYSIVLFPHQMAVVFDPRVGGRVSSTILAYGVVVLALAGMVLYTMRSVLEFERTSLARFPGVVIQGFFAALTPVVAWGAVLTLVAFVFNLARMGGLPGEAWGVTRDVLLGLLTSEASVRIQLLGVSLTVLAIAWLAPWKPGREYLRRLLKRYGIASSIFHPYALERFFAHVFDPAYDGKLDMETIVDRSLADDVTASRAEPGTGDGRKYVWHYASPERHERIHVGLAVADIDSGRMETIGENVAVVDGLVAAVAMTPLFPPKQIDDKLYVDGANVSNEPMEALLGLLRGKTNPRARMVQVYHAAPVPYSLRQLPVVGSKAYGRDQERGHSFLDLVEVTVRALRLKRFQDATLERRLTHLYTKVLPEAESTLAVEGFDKPFVRAWITPVEPDEPIDLNQRILGASKDERRRMVAETLADGCRAALQVMIQPSQDNAEEKHRILCRHAVEAHRARRKEAAQELDHLDLELPGADSPKPGRMEPPPGLKAGCWRRGPWRRPASSRRRWTA